MDYEKEYKEALERAEGIIRYYKEHNRNEAAIEDIEVIFPELRESDDEKIKSAILGFLEGSGQEIIVPGISTKEAINWLEKQHTDPYNGVGFDCYGHHWGMCARDGGVEILFDGELKAFISQEKSFIYPIHPQPDLSHKSATEENVGNPNCVKPTDKVELKFKVGDWITYNHNPNLPPKKIIQVTNEHYVFADCSFGNKTLEEDYHLWTIQDAKDGDVLVDEDINVIGIFDGIEGMCWHSKFDYSNVTKEFYGMECGGSHQNEFAKPATKEQRDLLFSKMKEVGYEWDAEKKELKLLITNGGDFTSEDCEQKPTWSEEDERIYHSLLADIRTRQDGSTNTLEAYYNEQIDWLKSLKERIQDKKELSEEDEEYLKRAIRAAKDIYPMTAKWLKSLKERIR